MEPTLTREDYLIARRVLKKIFNEYSNLDMKDFTTEAKERIWDEQFAVCEAMRQVDIDLAFWEYEDFQEEINE